MTYGRGNIARRVEEDGHVDESDPARGVSPVEGVDDTGYDGLRKEINQRFRDRVCVTHADDEEIHQTAVHLARLEETHRSDSSPDHGGIVDDLGSITPVLTDYEREGGVH